MCISGCAACMEDAVLNVFRQIRNDGTLITRSNNNFSKNLLGTLNAYGLLKFEALNFSLIPVANTAVQISLIQSSSNCS